MHISVTPMPHTHTTWTEVASSVPHFLQVGLLINPIIYRCLHRVLCPLGRPLTTLDCVQLKDSNQAFVDFPSMTNDNLFETLCCPA